VKNTLATVQSMVLMTARSAQSQDAYKVSLEKRIIALSKTHDMLTRSSWETVSLRDVLKAELKPYEDEAGRRVTLNGPTVPLSPRVAVALGMAAHELATNAAKHGSLSVPEGRLGVDWEVVDDGLGSRLHLTWKETGGPRVQEPSRKGFGSRLLQHGIARELDGETHLDFAVEGLGCRMLVSLDEAAPVMGSRPSRTDAAPSGNRATGTVLNS
jgi:two-component sensor histidine kinase